MAVTRTKNKIQFVQDILSVFTAFRHSGRGYLEYLRHSRGGDEFDVRDMIVKPLFRKLGYVEQDFYNEVTIQSGEVDLNIGTARLQPVITVETKATSVKDLKSARIDQLFPYLKELHTPIGIVTNGRSFEVWEQKAGMQLLTNIDFVPIVAEYLKQGINAISDDDFARILKFMYLKKEIRYISDEDLYAVPEIDIVEPTAFQNLLDDLAKMVEITRVDVEEQFDLYREDYRIFEQQQDKQEDWRLDRLRRDHKKSLQTIRYFHRWAELNNLDLEKNQNGQEKFVTETMYILINRILLIRIAEDKGIIPRQISNGAIKDFKHFIGGVKVDYNRLLKIAYDTMLGVYEHFFKHDIFDWYIPDSELLLQLLFGFNKYNFGHVNRDILGNLYQKYIDKEERKRLGQFYTPDEVVYYILDDIGYTSDAEIENKTLLDPACGSGGFLVPAANRLITRLKDKNFDPITILIKVRDNIYGFDINPFAAHLTETNLLFQVVDLISEAKKLDSDFRMEQFNVFVTDSLRIPEEGQKGKNMSLFENGLLNSAAVYDAEIVKDIKLKRGRFNEGVDFVVGNPPYVDPKIKTSQKRYLAWRRDVEKSGFFSTLKKKWDIYIAFIELALKLAKSQTGKLSLIISDSFLNIEYAKLSRELLVNSAKIMQIDFFPDLHLFPGVLVHNCIFFVLKEKPDAEHSVRRLKHLSPDLNNYVELETLNQIQFGTKVFRCDFKKLMDFPREQYLSLGEICFVSYGMALTSHEIKYPNEFKTEDLIFEKKPANIPTKPYIEGKDIENFAASNIRYLEYGTERCPKKVRRAKFPELFLCPKIMFGRQTGQIMYDDEGIFNNNTVINCLPWYMINGIENAATAKKCKNFGQTRQELSNTSKQYDLLYIFSILKSSFTRAYFEQSRTAKLDITPSVFELLPIKIITREAQKKFVDLSRKLIKTAKHIREIENTTDDLPKLVTKFKTKFPQYSVLQFLPLHDISGLKHIQLEKRLGNPNIRREAKRVYLTKNHYLDLDTEALTRYIELTLKSMQDRLRGLTKSDILGLVKVPEDEKVLQAILKYNSNLKKQKVKLERQRNAIDREIDEKVYELYGIAKEERQIIEGK